MHQLLPQIKGGFEHYLSGEKGYVEAQVKSSDWEEFNLLIEKANKAAEYAKERILKNAPYFLQDPLSDALKIKMDYDRVFSVCIVMFALGKEPWEFMDILFALELFDSSILIIDDILDKAERKGNDVTHHIKWGEPITLNISEILKSYSIKLILNTSLSDSKKLEILNELFSYHEKVYEGQTLDMLLEDKEISEISIDEYMNLISLTTGRQFRGFFRIGGLLSDQSSSVVNLLGDIGLDLGILAQIRDDLIDYLPDEELTWKMPLSDFIRNKKRLPLIIGWRNATSEERREIIELQQSECSSEKGLKILNLIFKPENLKEIRQIIGEIKQKGLDKISSESFTPYGRSLISTYFDLMGTDEI